MIPTTLTSTPPPAPLPCGVGIFNQIGNSCNNSALPSYTPALLGIASLILEGRDFIDDDYIPQRTQNVQNGDWSTLNKFNRHTPEPPSTYRIGYSDHSDGVRGYLSGNQKIDTDLYIDTATCSSGSAASLLNSQKTRWSQKLNQLRQEYPSVQSKEQIVEMETTSVNRSNEALDIGPMCSSSTERSNDNEMVRRVALNRIKTYNTLMTVSRESNIARFNGGSDDGYNVSSFSTNISDFVQENFMSSLQLLATNSYLRVGTPIYNTTCTSRPNPYLMRDVSMPSVSSNESPTNLIQTPKPSSYWLQNLVIPPLPIGQRRPCVTLSTTRASIPFQHATEDGNGSLQKFTKALDVPIVEMRSKCLIDKALKQCTNNSTPQEGPHCNQFLKKMGLIKAAVNCDVEEHCCDMSHINVTCARWRAHSIKIEDIVSRGETICIEVYLGPVDHKILLEQWIIAIKDKQPPPTMTLSSLCSAIRSQLYFSQVSAWCDLLKKADKKVYETGRLIFTTPLNSAAGDLVTSTPTTITSPTSAANISLGSINTGTAMSSTAMLQFNQRTPKLNIFFRIKQFDGTASFKSKPNVHNFPNVNLTESSCVSVCLKSLPRFSGGVPPIIGYNGQSVVPITRPSVTAANKTGVTMPKKSKASLASNIALNQSKTIKCDILQEKQPQQEKQKSAKNQKPNQILTDNLYPFNSVKQSTKHHDANDVVSVSVSEGSDNDTRPITFTPESTLNDVNTAAVGDNGESLLPLAPICKSNGNWPNALSNSSDDVANICGINSTNDYCGESLQSPLLLKRTGNCSNGNGSNENLKHRERQLMKYRKRMFKRDKHQEQHPHSQYFKISDSVPAVSSPSQLSPVTFRRSQLHYKSTSSTSSLATFKVDETSPSQLVGRVDEEGYAIEGKNENEDDNLGGAAIQHQHASVHEQFWKGMAVREAVNQRQHQPQLKISSNMSTITSIIPSNKEISNVAVRTMVNATPIATATISHNEIKMISTGTQTPANYCNLCGTLKTLICMQCAKYRMTSDPELSSAVINYKEEHDNKNNYNDDSKRNYTDDDNSYNNVLSKEIDLEVDSSCGNDEESGSVCSDNSLNTTEIIHTQRNDAQLLFQGMQRTSKAAIVPVEAGAPESPTTSSLPASVKKYRNIKMSSKEYHQSNINSTRNKNNRNNNYTKIKNNNNNDNDNNSNNSKNHNNLGEAQILLNNDDEDIIIANVSVITKAITTTTASAMTAMTAKDKNNIPIKSNTLLVIGCQVCKRQKTQHNFLSPEQESKKLQQAIPLENIIESKNHHVTPTVTEKARTATTATKTLYTALYDNKNHKTAINNDDDDDDDDNNNNNNNNNKKHNEKDENAITTTKFNTFNNVVQVEKSEQCQGIDNNQSPSSISLVNSKMMDHEDNWRDNNLIDEEFMESSIKFMPRIKPDSITTTTNTITTTKGVAIAPTKSLFCNYLYQQQEGGQQQAETSPPPLVLISSMRNKVLSDQNHNDNVANKDEQHNYDYGKRNIMAQFKTPTKESTIITTAIDFEKQRRQQTKQKQPPRHKNSLSKLWKIGCNFHYNDNANDKYAAGNDVNLNMKDTNGIESEIEKMESGTSTIANYFKNHLTTGIKNMNNIDNDNNNNNNENNSSDKNNKSNNNNESHYRNNYYHNNNVDANNDGNNNSDDDYNNNNNNNENNNSDNKYNNINSSSNTRRNLLKVNLTPIFCKSSAKMSSPDTSNSLTLLSTSYFMDGNDGLSTTSLLMNDKINNEITKMNNENLYEKRRKEGKSLEDRTEQAIVIPNLKMPNRRMPTFTFDSSNSPTSPTSPSILQKSNSTSILPNSSRFYNVYTICNRRSRLSERSSIVSEEQYSDDDIDCLGSGTTSTTVQSSNKLLRNHQRCSNMLFARKPLLGNLEESLLQRRLLPKLEVTGFRLLLGASGNFCPIQLTLPADAYFYELYGDTLSTPYLCEARLPRKGYTIPRFGTVQATLLNPMGTVVRMFVIPYDMSDMPSLHQTFVRQRILADNSGDSGDKNLYSDINIDIDNGNSTTNKLPIKTVMSTAKITTIMQDYNNCDNNTSSGDCYNNVLENMTIHIRQQQQRSPNCRNESNLRHFIPPKDMKSLRYSIHLRFQTSRSGRLMLHTDIRLLISKRTDCDTAAAHAKGILETTNNDLIIDTVMPTNPKYSVRQQQQEQQQQEQEQDSTIMNKI